MSEKESNWKFAEDIVSESEVIARAREHSLELGVEAISPAIGAQIGVVAAALVEFDAAHRRSCLAPSCVVTAPRKTCRADHADRASRAAVDRAVRRW